jgi:hypothetical protein
MSVKKEMSSMRVLEDKSDELAVGLVLNQLLSSSLFYSLSGESLAVQHSVITFQTNCELNTIPMLLTVEIKYSVNIKNNQILKGGMTYV